MAVPRLLSDWTLAAIEELVDDDYHEDDAFDFKEALDIRAVGHIERILKAACSLANTKGGFLVFGVAETGSGRSRVVGIPDSRENAKHVTDKFKGAEPSLRFDILNPPIRLSIGKVVFVVEVLPAGRGPHRGPRNQFWRRSQGTAVEMTYGEIENAFVNYSERRSRLHLVYVSLVDNWLRFEQIRATRDSDSFLSTYVPDMSQIRQHLGDVNSLCPEAVRPLMELLQIADLITFRLSAMTPTMNMPLSNKRQMTADHNRVIAEIIDGAQSTFEQALTTLQARFGFESVAIGPDTRVPPLPVPA